MSIKVRCNQCAKKDKLETIFVYKGIYYCTNCLYELIFDLAKDGAIGLYTTNVKKKGIIVRK